MPFIEVEPGVLLHVRDVGEGDPVVLVPGWSHSGAVWDGQVRELLDAGRRAIAIDPRGQGLSDAPASGYSIDQHARDVVSVLDQLELPRVDLVGWSLGGVAAFRVAAHHADRVRSLVLIGSNGIGVASTGAFPHGLPRQVMEQFVAGELSARPAARTQSIEGAIVRPDASTVDWLVRDSMLTPSWAAIGSLRGLFEADQAEDITSVTAPVLMLHGDSDQLFPLAGARWVCDRLPNGRLSVLPGVGHFPHVEDAATVSNELVAFLADREQ